MRCQWISGEPSADDGCKCGAPVTDPLSPYCADHARRAVRPMADNDAEPVTVDGGAGGVDDLEALGEAA